MEVVGYLVEQRSDGSVVEFVHDTGLAADAGELDPAQWSRGIRNEHELSPNAPVRSKEQDVEG